jgi:hypothetical protein
MVDIDDPEKIIPDTPAAYELCTLNFTIFNQDSEQRNLERLCCFPMLTIQTDDNEENYDFGSDSVLTYSAQDGNSVNKPEWIAPNDKILTVIRESSEKNALAIVEVANQMGSTAVTKGEAKSGVALSYEFLGQNYALKNISKHAESYEEKVAHIVSLWTGKAIDLQVKYTDNYKPNQSDYINVIEMLKELINDDNIAGSFTAQMKLELALSVANFLNFEVDEQSLRQEISQSLSFEL